MKKKGQKGVGWPVVVLIVAGLILFYPQISTLFEGAPEPEPIEPEPTEPGFICPVDTTTLGFSAVDVDDPGTQVNLNARYWIEGKPQGTVDTGSTTTVSPGDDLAVWFAAGNDTYYGSYFDGEQDVPCKGTYDVSGKLWTKDTGVTLTVFDEFENPQTGAANNQTIGIGEVVEMKLRVKGNHEKYYGNPEVSLDNLLAIEHDRTEIDSVKVTLDGVELDSGNVPTAEAVSSTDNVEVGFLMPKIAGSSSVDYFLVITADDIENPSADMTVKIYDADYYYNSETGKIETGHEDQANNDIGVTTEPSATVYLS